MMGKSLIYEISLRSICLLGSYIVCCLILFTRKGEVFYVVEELSNVSNNNEPRSQGIQGFAVSHVDKRLNWLDTSHDGDVKNQVHFVPDIRRKRLAK